MSQYPQYPQQRVQSWGTRDTEADRVVFNFFNVVYAWMAVGLAVTAVVGYVVSSNDAILTTIYGAGKGAFIAVFLCLTAIAWFVQGSVGRLSVGTATTLFLLYAAGFGVLLSGIFLVYPPGTLISAFAVTGGVFALFSVYGFITRRDLTNIGSMALMLFLGVVIASVVNVWVANDTLGWIITYATVGLVVVITAYKTQELKMMALQLQDQPQLAARVAIVGSLIMYISFINLFVAILRIMGSRR
jgi:FtsH-binding integral membrane protein